ncbi:MAG: ATP-binding protein [Candidatus Zixiibacteriota bacterium]
MGKSKILIVEDEKEIGLVIEYMLQVLEYAISDIVDNGKDAIEKAKEDSVDLVLMDIHLKGKMDGIEAAEIIKSKFDIPVIYITGFADSETLERSKTSFPFGYILKPVNERELHTTIEMGLYRHKLEKKLRMHNENLEVLIQRRTNDLEASNRRLRITLSSMSEGLISFDNDGNIILFNAMASVLTGFNSEEVVGRKMSEIIKFYNEHEGFWLENPVDKVLGTGEIYYLPEDTMIQSKEDNDIFVEGSAAPILDVDENIIGVVLIIRDVSEKREIERMKDDFISSISHELRTPLTSIKGYAATILRDPKMPKKIQAKFLNIVNDEADRLKALVDDLLEFSRMESGRMRLVLDQIDIPAIVHEVIEAIMPNAQKKDIQLEENFEPNFPLYIGDNRRIYSVIMNLVSNAVKFTLSDGKVNVDSVYDNENIKIFVKDSGIGIPKAKLEAIFDRFYRIERPGMEIPGTGLGLAITKRIVDLHGGSIEVESVPQKGSIFTVILPRSTKFAKSDTLSDSQLIMINK